ncbi:MAG: DUF357 domain-containing protein [Candidatus Micrarchaeia archaeon]
MPKTERQRAETSLKKLRQHLKKCSKLERHFKAQYELARQYCEDAAHYFRKGDYFTSFGCSDYAYGLLDAILMVKENQYFPEPVVGAVILRSDGRIFLMKSPKFHNKYCIPGGHIEIGEKAENALVREIYEETGLKVYGLRHIITHEFIHDHVFHKKRHFIMIDYVCRAHNPDEVRLNEEGTSYKWLTVDAALKSRDIEPYTLTAIRAAREQSLI